MNFNEASFRAALRSGECEPDGIIAPFINIDRRAYDAQWTEWKNNDGHKKWHLELRKRLGDTEMHKTRGPLAFMLHHSRRFFPSFEFFASEFVNEDWLSSVDWHKPFHRDHIKHQSMSVYVGLWLLRKFKPYPGITLLDKCVEVVLNGNRAKYLLSYLREMGAPEIILYDNPIARVEWEKIIVNSFFLAALFHDIGYPQQFVATINKKLNKSSPTGDPYKTVANWVTDKYYDRLIFYPLHGYSAPHSSDPVDWKERVKDLVHKCLTSTHGMPGAIALLQMNDSLRQFPENDSFAVKRFCVEWAAMAVMMHDMSKIYRDESEVDKSGKKAFKYNMHLRLKFGRDPLSCVMTLTDQLQDFCRPNASFSHGTSGGVEIKYNSLCNGTTFDWNDSSRSLIIKHWYKNFRDFYYNSTKSAPDDTIHLYDRDTGFVDLREAGINTIRLEPQWGTCP